MRFYARKNFLMFFACRCPILLSPIKRIDQSLMESIATGLSGHIESKKQLIKLKHVNACMLKESQYLKSAGFESVELLNQSAGGLSMNDISQATTFLGHKLKAPLMIAPMTGGSKLGAMLNQRWARACEHFGLPFGVGSQRLALEDERVKESFMVRKHAPTALIFANLGAAQLRQSQGLAQAVEAVKMIEANALFIHLNPLQEACQEHGDRNFCGILEAIRDVMEALALHKIPVLVREVGFGLSTDAASALIDTGIAGLDCAGAGGTSWARVEALCATSEKYQRLGQSFGEWGIPTAQSIKNVREVSKKIPLIATGGIRSGLDVAKAIALGANMAAMAQPMLMAAVSGEDELFSYIEQILLELRVAMFAAGAKDISDLSGLVAE
jgi:isopentenyl-diphosphate delta-isomerase